MQSILRNFVLAPVVMAAAALATNTAMAETVNVPFSFTVNGKNLPAGYYSVRREISQNMVTLRSNVSSDSFTWIVTPGNPDPNETAVVLKFDEAGPAHALQSVQYGPLVTSKLDKKTKLAPTRIVPGQ